MNVLASGLDVFSALRPFGLAGARGMSYPAPGAPGPLSADLSKYVLDIARTCDRAAFAALYSHFAPRLKTYLMRLGLPSNIAEELAQETMVTVWRKAATFSPGRAAASTWIFTIARNLRIDHLRRNRLPADFDPDPSQALDETPSPDAALLGAEQIERVRVAMAELSPDQVVIVQLFYFHEKPHSEIAKALGIPLGTVKSRVRLALGRLRSLLEDLR